MFCKMNVQLLVGSSDANHVLDCIVQRLQKIFCIVSCLFSLSRVIIFCV